MDDFDALDEGDGQTHETVPGKPDGQKKGRGKGSKVKEKNSNCFVCSDKKLRNSKFCKDHNRAYENMKYQAQHAKPPEIAAFNQVMSDPGKAKVAIDDFIRDNPEGTSRKRLVDWASWKREHGVRISYTVREGEVLLDIDDYYVERAQPRGKTRQESDEAFKELMKGPYDREGDGPLTKLWLPKLKERMRDRTHYADASVVEGSKQIKDVDKKDRDDLMQVCQTAVGGHDSSFIRGASGQLASTQESSQCLKPKVELEDDPDTKAPEKKRRSTANVTDERPKKYGKLNKELPTVRKIVSDALDKLTKALGLVVDDDKNDPELQAYLETARARESLGKMWLSASLEEATLLMSSPAGFQKSLSQESVGGDGDAAASPPEMAMDAKSVAASIAPSDASSPVSASVSTGAPSGAPKRTVGNSGKSTGERVTSMLFQMADSNHGSLPVQSLQHLLSFCEMGEIKEKVLQVSSMEELDEKLQMWRESVQQVRLLAGGISKSAQNLSTHVSNMSRKAEREESKKRKLAETLAVAEAKKKAKAAAKRVKDEQASVPPLFMIGLDKLQQTSVAEAMKEMSEDGAVDIDLPLLYKNTKIAEWSNTPKMQVALGSFGGRYKKTDSFSSSGKAQMTLFSKEGKEESFELINHFLSAVSDPSKVKGEHEFNRITDTLWLYGYDPELRSISSTPNGMPMLKVLAFGEVKWLVMECGSLLAALRKESGLDTISQDDLDSMLNNMTIEGLESCKKHGLKCFSCLQAANQAVYVPAGWIAVEECVKGVLVYGLRASFLFRSDASHASYEALIGACAAAGKPVDKMKQALELMVPVA